MNQTNKKATIFCASSPKLRQVFFDEARELTNMLVSNGYGIVYGGGSVGLMGCVADEALRMEGEVIGIIPQFMVDVEWQHRGVADMRLTQTMAERKKLLIDLADVIFILPGSTGTMDELFDAMADKKLGLLHKPIIILNTDGFYSSLRQQLQKMVDENFMKQCHLDTVYFASSPADAINYLSSADANGGNLTLLDAAVK